MGEKAAARMPWVCVIPMLHYDILCKVLCVDNDHGS